MAKYEFLGDVTNTAGTLSKDHFPEISAGSVVDYGDEVPERIKQLEKINVVRLFIDEEKAPDQDPDQLPDDYIKLKEIADGLGIDYPGNISKKDLVEKIQEKQAEEK
jgi:hypothetical protein